VIFVLLNRDDHPTIFGGMRTDFHAIVRLVF
jgi:hypothetical protein